MKLLKISYYKKSITARDKGTIESAMTLLPENIVKYENNVLINLFRKIFCEKIGI